MILEQTPEALTFDDVLLLPGHSTFLPRQADLRARLVREGITLNMPILSAAMDTVTEKRMAVAMAKQGGIGVVHKNMPAEQQAEIVAAVKRTQSGVISDPVTIAPLATVEQARALMETRGISGLPVVDQDRVVGIFTRRDAQASEDPKRVVAALMTPRERLHSVAPGTAPAEAMEIMRLARVEKLLVLGPHDALCGLITMKDLRRDARYPNEVCDAQSRLLVAAAIGPGADCLGHAHLLIAAGADILVIDTAHGDSDNVFEALRALRAIMPNQPIIVGNVASFEAADALCQLGASAIKVGMGPGSICTTRIVAGVGVPQVTAIGECARAARVHGVPVIGDGGIKHSGDVVKAIAAGADTVMLGSMLAGTDEAPGDVVLFEGRQYKTYRGMGSLGAMRAGAGARGRYQQGDVEPIKLVPEGVQGRVPYRGPVRSILEQIVGGLRAGMGYTGCRTIEALQKDGRFVRQSVQGVRESHPHDITITEEAPNYRR